MSGIIPFSQEWALDLAYLLPLSGPLAFAVGWCSRMALIRFQHPEAALSNFWNRGEWISFLYKLPSLLHSVVTTKTRLMQWYKCFPMRCELTQLSWPVWGGLRGRGQGLNQRRIENLFSISWSVATFNKYTRYKLRAGEEIISSIHGIKTSVILFPPEP